MFEECFPFPKVGYVNSLEGILPQPNKNYATRTCNFFSKSPPGLRDPFMKRTIIFWQTQRAHFFPQTNLWLKNQRPQIPPPRRAELLAWQLKCWAVSWWKKRVDTTLLLMLSWRVGFFSVMLRKWLQIDSWMLQWLRIARWLRAVIFFPWMKEGLCHMSKLSHRMSPSF